jgi:uncharacterized ferredoxin-like protein
LGLLEVIFMQNAVEMVGELMALSAKTAPKTRGEDELDYMLLTGQEKDEVAEEMLKISQEQNNPGFTRDGNNVKDSQALLLIGLKSHSSCGFECAACGFDSCGDFDSTETEGKFKGPNCPFRVLDMGIALGSAVKTAAIHNVDNRIMYRVGVAVMRLDIMDCTFVMGIPLSVSQKNIYFDRKA